MTIKYIPEGDKFRASQLWGEGRHQLSILKNLMSFRNLQQDQRLVHFADGTIIKCLSCFGQDVINIFVPQVFVGGAPEYREREEITYYPAFEAYDGTDITANQIGYVICKGGGFNPPYEFIEINRENTDLDLFEWGQGYIFNDYQPLDEPNSTIESYLIPKFLSAPEETRELHDIPPHGTRNRIFLASSSLTTNIVTATDETTRYDCCWVDEAHSSGSHQHPGGSGWIHDKDREGTQAEEFVFCMSDEAKSPGFVAPTERLEADSYYSEGSTDYSVHKKSFGTNLPIFAGEKYSSGVKTGLDVQGPYAAPWMEVTGLTCLDIIPILEAETIPGPELRISTFSIEYEDSGTHNFEYEYQINDLIESNTSADNEEHYSLLYVLSKEKYIGDFSVTCSGFPCGDEPEGDVNAPYDHVNHPSLITEESEEIFLGLSGEIREISEHLGEDSSCQNIRYFRVNNKEFTLSNVVSEFGEDNFKTTYFFATKTNGKPMEFAQPATLDSYGRFVQIPGIKDSNDNQVYTHGQFRLIRETVIVKEMATAEQPGLFREIT